MPLKEEVRLHDGVSWVYQYKQNSVETSVSYANYQVESCNNPITLFPHSRFKKLPNEGIGLLGSAFRWRHIKRMGRAAYMSRMTQSIQPNGVSMPR
jgi:hypothetical protein